MNTNELSHLVATVVRGFIVISPGIYQDSEGTTWYQVNYCDSPSHALDLAQEQGLTIKPTPDAWQCFKPQANSFDPIEGTIGEDVSIGKAIVLAALRFHGQSV
jgi:hypothetical protein